MRIRAAAKRVLLYLTFIPERIGRSFSRQDYARFPHPELIRRAGMHATSAQQVISASLAEPAAAARLKIDVGAPVPKIRTTFFAQRTRPVRYLEVVADPAMFELHMTFGPPRLDSQVAHAPERKLASIAALYGALRLTRPLEQMVARSNEERPQ